MKAARLFEVFNFDLIQVTQLLEDCGSSCEVLLSCTVPLLPERTISKIPIGKLTFEQSAVSQRLTAKNLLLCNLKSKWLDSHSGKPIVKVKSNFVILPVAVFHMASFLVGNVRLFFVGRRHDAAEVIANWNEDDIKN